MSPEGRPRGPGDGVAGGAARSATGARRVPQHRRVGPSRSGLRPVPRQPTSWYSAQNRPDLASQAEATDRYTQQTRNVTRVSTTLWTSGRFDARLSPAHDTLLSWLRSHQQVDPLKMTMRIPTFAWDDFDSAVVCQHQFASRRAGRHEKRGGPREALPGSLPASYGSPDERRWLSVRARRSASMWAARGSCPACRRYRRRCSAARPSGPPSRTSGRDGPPSRSCASSR